MRDDLFSRKAGHSVGGAHTIDLGGGATQSMMLQERDDQILGLKDDVTRLRLMMGGINDAITEQNSWLDDLHNNMEKTSGMLAGMMRKTKRLLNSGGNCN